MKPNNRLSGLLGVYLKKRRQELNLTQQFLCDQLGFTCQFYGKIEKGISPCPTYAIKKLVVLLKLRHSDLSKIFKRIAQAKVDQLFED